jgi:hypothetical protein
MIEGRDEEPGVVEDGRLGESVLERREDWSRLDALDGIGVLGRLGPAAAESNPRNWGGQDCPNSHLSAPNQSLLDNGTITQSPSLVAVYWNMPP